MEIEIQGQQFTMLHQKALYWQDRKTMLISDLHLGKITHFRKAGIAVPSNAHGGNLTKLDELLTQHQTERVFLLGDLFHHDYNQEWDQFVAWRLGYETIAFTIMLGNHDRLPHSLLRDATIFITTELPEGPFLFTHHPQAKATEGKFVFSGHVHPVYGLRSPASPTLRLPCFVFDAHQAILPSFGVFTGGFEVHKQANRRIFVVADQSILAV